MIHIYKLGNHCDDVTSSNPYQKFFPNEDKFLSFCRQVNETVLFNKGAGVIGINDKYFFHKVHWVEHLL